MSSRAFALFLTFLALGCDGTLQLGMNDGGPEGFKDSGGSDSKGPEPPVVGDSGGDGSHDSSIPGDSSTALDGGADGGTVLAALTAGGAEDAGSCVQSCSADPSAPMPFTFNAQLLGSWRICSGDVSRFPPKTIGLEFDPSGTLFYLVAGPSGDPVRGTGFEYQTLYQTDFGAFNGTSGIFVAVMGAEPVDYAFEFSACPRQALMTLAILCGG
jgi:hypothetical protein